ncbi:hypothetical protein [uncultured Vagococcus sp.]|uniref:hypothetical protein n=1 Tax=uncultured Vagococcus sp. TaxID=189676 RepID=UPI0028D00FD2|nr:hypothetical protein [uncultured Vagococcus sp.]
MTKFEERGHKVTTHEGHTGYVAPEIKEYFVEKYMEQPIRVVPGHWPSMETKQDVDKWIDSLRFMRKLFDEMQLDNEDEEEDDFL